MIAPVPSPAVRPFGGHDPSSRAPDLGRVRWRVPALAALLFLGVAALGVVVGYLVLPVGELGRPPYLLDSLFHWDALDYLRVAQHGYQWNALRPTVGSDIGFYPAYPLIEAALGHFFRSWAPALLTLPSVLFGIAAIFAFDRLALRLLAPRGATVATFGYALYPAACFTLNGYPTSLINLALVLMFAAVVDRRLLRSGCWAGVATLAGPLAAVAALAVPLQFVASAVGGRGRALGERVRRALSTSGTMLLATCLAFSGILGFVAYQAVTLGNPTAFISAQQAWGYAALGVRLARAVTLFPLTYYYGQPVLNSGSVLARNRFEMFLQSELGVICLVVCVALVIAQARSSPWPMTVVAALMILAFYWLSGTVIGAISAPRELYAVIPAFIGLGALADQRPWLAWSLVAVFAVGLVGTVAATAAGYMVV